MAWIEPIYDRTEQDVLRVKQLIEEIKSGKAVQEEIVEYKTDLKGALNRSDLERIVGNINYLADMLDVTIQTQTVPEIPRVSWYNVLLSNLNIVLNAYAKYPDTPEIPIQPLNTYEKWNIIEKIIWDIKDLYQINEHYYAGNDELYANNNGII